jgi:hypothetical protein
VYEVSVFPSMRKGEIIGHIFIDILSLMSTIMIRLMMERECSRETRLISGGKVY